MLTSDLANFVTAWRGYLIPHRRLWHSHQKVHLEGYRSDFGLARSDHQVDQFRRVTRLVGHVFARGGQLWTFGLVCSTGGYPWGMARSDWSPGTLSNSFYLRVRPRGRIVSVRSPPRGRPRPRRWRFPARTHRFRSVLHSYLAQTSRAPRPVGYGPDNFYDWLTVREAARSRRFRVRLQAVPPLRRDPTDFSRGRTLITLGVAGVAHRRRRRWRAVYVPGRGRDWVSRFTLGRNPISRVGRVRFSRYHTRLLHLVRTRRRVRRSSLFQGRFQRWFSLVPGITAGGGFTLRQGSFLTEVASLGAPFVYLHGGEVNPRVGGYPLLWNTSPGSTWGWSRWWTLVWAGARRQTLLAGVWLRLAER